MNRILLTLIFSIWCIYFSFGQELNLTKGQWIEDLNFMSEKLKETHPNVYYRLTENEYKTELEAARSQINAAKDDIQCYIALKKFIAKIKDGHTRLSDANQFGFTKFRLPVRIEKFPDGVFITATHKNQQDYYGKKVTHLNGIDIEQVLTRTAEIDGKDNQFGKIGMSALYLSFPRILKGLDLIDDESQVTLTLELNGKSTDVTIATIEQYVPDEWYNIFSALGDSSVLHLKHSLTNRKYYWFEPLVDDSLVYFQFNNMYDASPNTDEGWIDFNARMWKYLDDNDEQINKLVIDLRHSTGGNGRLLYPFINDLIKRDKYRIGSNLFVLLGNQTFSAPLVLLSELMVHANPILIGSPPGHSINFFSNQRFICKLPNSGVRLHVATRQVDDAWNFERIYISPDIPAPILAKDYFTGFDPGLRVVQQYNEKPDIADYTIKHGSEKAMKYVNNLKQQFEEYEWWYGLDSSLLEYKINKIGNAFMRYRMQKEAFEILKLNTLLFPNAFNVWDSFAQWHYHEKQYQKALEFYEKSVALNPQNSNGVNFINRIKKLIENKEE
jgi:hypothetical protein